MEVDNLLESDPTRILWSRCRNGGNIVKVWELVEVVVVAMDVEAMVELLQTLVELISTPFLEL
jgi:hypothetical protein